MSSDDCFSPSSSPSPLSPSDDASSHNNHKQILKSLQMKFTYLKEPRKRTRTTPEQLDTLITFFNKEPCPSIKQRKQLSKKTGMTPRAIQVWFQNKRAKFKIPSTHQQNNNDDDDDSDNTTTTKAQSVTPQAATLFIAAAAATTATANFTPYLPFQAFLKPQEGPLASHLPQCQYHHQQQQQQPQEQNTLYDPEQVGFDNSSPSSFSEDSSYDINDEEIKNEEFDFFDFVLPHHAPVDFSSV